jgi:hypothetical protein
MSNKLTINNSIKSMINTKKDYESPTTNVIFIKVHGILCQSTGEASINDWEDGITITF